MDPLSITVGAVSLAKICGVISFELGKFVQEAGHVSTVISSLQADVKDFGTVLGVLNDTVNNAEIKQSLASSGRIGSYWSSLAVSLEDARQTLDALEKTVVRINKSTNILDSVRKQMRLKFATDEVNMYRQRISTFKDTVQIILNTTTIWHQVSNRNIPAQVVPRLDETQDMIRRLGLQFNERMASLQSLIHSHAAAEAIETTKTTEKEEFESLENLRECLKGAASVMTSASTIVGRRVQDGSSTIYGSDFGDVFPSDPNDMTLNWIRENAVQESDEGYATNSEISRGNLPQKANFSELPGERDYDEELELEMTQACYEQGLQHLTEKNIEAAEQCFQNCIDSSGEQEMLVIRSQKHIDIVIEAMEELCHIFVAQRRWDEQQLLLKKKLHLNSRSSTPNESLELADKLDLAEALYRCEDYQEALLYCRSVEVGYRNRGDAGVKDRLDCLELLTTLYNKTNRQREAQMSSILVQRLKSPRGSSSATVTYGMNKLSISPPQKQSTANSTMEKPSATIANQPRGEPIANIQQQLPPHSSPFAASAIYGIPPYFPSSVPLINAVHSNQAELFEAVNKARRENSGERENEGHEGDLTLGPDGAIHAPNGAVIGNVHNACVVS